MGWVRRADQGGRRWAKGEAFLKLVVKVNVAREVRMPCSVSFMHATEDTGYGGTIAIQTWIHRLVKKLNITVPSGGNICGYCLVFFSSFSCSESRGPG